MSRVGVTTGLPSAGENRFSVDIIRMRASACAAADSGTCTAIWSPSKSALNAVTNQRVNLNRLAVHQHRLEGLDPQAVERRGAVEHDRMLADHLFQRVPDLRASSGRSSASRS